MAEVLLVCAFVLGGWEITAAVLEGRTALAVGWTVGLVVVALAWIGLEALHGGR